MPADFFSATSYQLPAASGQQSGVALGYFAAAKAFWTNAQISGLI